MTCNEIFKDFPYKPDIRVIPELTEVFRYSCDLTDSIDDKIEDFGEYNFDRFDKGDLLWFLDHQSKETWRLCIDEFNKNNVFTYREKQLEILILMFRKLIFESDLQARIRTNRIKQMLKIYQEELHYSRIMLISHHYIIQHLLASGYTPSHEPITAIEDEVPNAVAMTVDLAKMWKVR